MLAQTVRSNLKDINNLKMRTKTTKFSSLFQSAPTTSVEEVEEVRQVLMKDGLFDVSQQEWEEITVEEDEEETDDFDIVEEGDELYEIVEDTTQVVVSFPIISDIELEEKLPFFRAVSLKLASL